MNPSVARPLDEAVAVLFVNPQEDGRRSLERMLEPPDWRLLKARSCDEAAQILSHRPVPVVICERDQPDGDWKALLDRCCDLPRPPRLIVSSRLADASLWAEVLNLGGYDLLMTPFDPEEVRRVVSMACESWARQHSCDSLSAKPPNKARQPAETKAAGAGDG